MNAWAPDGWVSGIRHVHSPNFGPRPASTTVSLVVIHNISLPPGEFAGEWVEHFFLNALDPQAHPYFSEIASLKVSAHFFIRRTGELIQFVSADDRAWHAGASSWQGRANCNDYSIGIELEGTDEIPYSEAQYGALFTLIDLLGSRYPITGIAGHVDIAPGRKTDPGNFFEWSRIRERYATLDLPPEKPPETLDGLA